MFSALGSALHRRRIAVLLLALLVTALATAYGGSVSERLSNGLSDYDDPGGGNVAAREIIGKATGTDPQQGYVLLVRTDERVTADTAPPAAVTAAAGLLRSRAEVEQVVDYTSATGGAALIARDGRSTVVVGAVGPLTDQESVRATDELREAIEDDPALRGRTWLGGATPGHVQVAEVSDEDLAQAELLAMPVILIVLFLVFRGLVAALIPLLGGVVSLMLTMAGLRVATEFTQVSTGSMSLAFALGLGLSIDFGLLIVSRYREELADRGPGAEAILRTVATAGRTVLFSALTVAAALAALLAFPQPYLRSMGLAGVVTVVSAALFALVGLPALLALLGRRINSLAPRRWQRTAGVARAEGRWYRLARTVMRRPAVFALAATAVLLTIASPLLGVRFTGVDPTVLPEETSAGRVAAVMDKDYDARATSPVQIVLDTKGTPDASRLTDYTDRVAAIPGIESAGTPFRLDATHWEIDAVLTHNPLDETSKDAVADVQNLTPPHPARYTGTTADYLAQRESIADSIPLAAGILVGVTLLLLFAFSGSVVLPVKALLMNLLSTGAAFGFLVWVFQDGNLGLPAQNALETTTPVLVFALAFGLSTDYNVFLLSRIKEARSQGLDDREAVAHGLSRTGGIVTSAAILFCVPVGALALSRLVFVQELGLGAAFAVLIDATVVRALLVPSLMALLGTANWWSPPFLRTLHRALHLDRMEHTPAPPPAAPLPEKASSSAL
ncbi:MMPL family transporter [Streptomyces sp. NPDC002920]